MQTIINTTATKARQNLYNLIDQVAKDNALVKIHKKNLDHPVVIKRADSVSKTPLKSQLKIIRQTSGSIKTSGYKPDEMQKAAEIFVKEYRG